MRKLFLTAFVLAASLVVASSGLALEKTAARITDDSRDGWAAGTTCSVAYYNTCTGWVWIWSGWSPNDRIGVNFDTCGDNCTLESNWWYVWTAAPSGYGFTGTIDVFAADGSGCPTGAALASQVFLPASGWNLFSWGGLSVPNSFVVAGTVGSGNANPIALASDHPAAGPTGPAACGNCYPTTRVNHSYYYGTPGSPLCPGSALNDGICDAQLFLDAQLTCTVAVEQESWGSVKNLYR